MKQPANLAAAAWFLSAQFKVPSNRRDWSAYRNPPFARRGQHASDAESGLLSLEPETGRIVDSAISASLIGELARANEVLPTLAQPVSVSE